MVVIKREDLILTGATSQRTHYADCDWALAQERNANIRWQRHRRTTDLAWFTKRKSDQELRAALGLEPHPICTYCGCDV